MGMPVWAATKSSLDQTVPSTWGEASVLHFPKTAELVERFVSLLGLGISWALEDVVKLKTRENSSVKMQRRWLEFPAEICMKNIENNVRKMSTKLHI